MKISEILTLEDEKKSHNNAYDSEENLYWYDELSDEENEDWDNKTKELVVDAHVAIQDYTESGGNYDLDQAYHTIMKYQPRYAYSGEMYRSIILKPEDMLVPDLRTMTAKLHRWAMQHSREIVSWSVDLDFVIEHGGDWKAGLVLYQESKGLDIISMDGTSFEDEQEVLSPYSNNLSIYGFISEEEFFPVNEFNRFLKHLKSLDNIENS